MGVSVVIFTFFLCAAYSIHVHVWHLFTHSLYRASLYLYREFINCVRCIRILSPAEVQQMSENGMHVLTDCIQTDQ